MLCVPICSVRLSLLIFLFFAAVSAALCWPHGERKKNFKLLVGIPSANLFRYNQSLSSDERGTVPTSSRSRTWNLWVLRLRLSHCAALPEGGDSLSLVVGLCSWRELLLATSKKLPQRLGQDGSYGVRFALYLDRGRRRLYSQCLQGLQRETHSGLQRRAVRHATRFVSRSQQFLWRASRCLDLGRRSNS